MAFNRPIEADQVDDFGLFSTFIRAPLVGVIMWAIGGDEAKRQEEEQRDRQAKLGGEEEPPIPPTQLQQMITHNRMKKKGKKMPPRLIGSDLSDFGHLAIQSESDVEDAEDDAGGGLKRNKKMSWSDESGQSLCEVADEMSITHEPQHGASVPASQPMKSAMKRSRSIQQNAALNGLGSDPTRRFLPKGLSAGHGGIIYPTHPNTQSSAGYVSPEGWGWYITTTPPTPDMYHHASKLPKKGTTHSTATSKRTTLTNPAFKTGSQKTAVGWPSVPL